MGPKADTRMWVRAALSTQVSLPQYRSPVYYAATVDDVPKAVAQLTEDLQDICAGFGFSVDRPQDRLDHGFIQGFTAPVKSNIAARYKYCQV